MSEKQTFDDLRHTIGRIIGQSMGNGQMKDVIKQRLRTGHFAERELQDVVIAILEYLESRDDVQPENKLVDKA